MRRRNFFYGLIVTFLFTATSANGQQLPKSINIGANPPGSLFYALASGLAKVISDSAAMQAQVQPYTGTSTLPETAIAQGETPCSRNESSGIF